MYANNYKLLVLSILYPTLAQNATATFGSLNYLYSQNHDSANFISFEKVYTMLYQCVFYQIKNVMDICMSDVDLNQFNRFIVCIALTLF